MNLKAEATSMSQPQFRPRKSSFKQSMRSAIDVTSLRDVQSSVGCHIPLKCVYHAHNKKNGWDEYKVVFGPSSDMFFGYTNMYLEPVQ
jgi:hypothetical protein